MRLFNAYFIKANDVVYDKDGNIIGVLATYDEATRVVLDLMKKTKWYHSFVSATNLFYTFNFFGPMMLDIESENILNRFNKDSWTKKHGFVKNHSKRKTFRKFQFLDKDTLVLIQHQQQAIYNLMKLCH